jgi:uncharacterized protein YecT (DUF1311 family)
MIAALLLALALQSPSAAQAGEPDCNDAETQMDMNHCAGERFGQADAQLNRVYRDVVRQEQAADRDAVGMIDSHPTNEEALRASQRAWLAFRDAQCEYESFEARGGSMQPMLYEDCRARMTRERIRQLSQPEHEGN